MTLKRCRFSRSILLFYINYYVMLVVVWKSVQLNRVLAAGRAPQTKDSSCIRQLPTCQAITLFVHKIIIFLALAGVVFALQTGHRMYVCPVVPDTSDACMHFGRMVHFCCYSCCWLLVRLLVFFSIHTSNLIYFFDGLSCCC